MAAPPPAPVEPGQVVAGKYRVERVIGRGGMGVVVAATHVDLRETRALKFMLPEALGDPEAVERFLREARAASRLKGPHVAKVFDVGRLDDGAPFLVMEYLEGSDLQRVLKRRGSMPAGEVAGYLVEACEALAEAHARGIIHRDLKISNLFLVEGEGEAASIKVFDFGISKILGDAAMTQSQVVLGSPYYMPPEQLRSSRDVDARADVWALGVIGYQLVSGHLPFRGRTMAEIITSVISTEPPPLPPGLPPGFEAVLLRCLVKDPNGRTAGMGELAAALVPFAPPEHARHLAVIDRLLAPGRGPSSVADPPSSSQPVSGNSAWGRTDGGKGRASRPLVVGLALGAALAIAGLVALFAAWGARDRAEDAQPVRMSVAAAPPSSARGIADPLAPSPAPAPPPVQETPAPPAAAVPVTAAPSAAPGPAAMAPDAGRPRAPARSAPVDTTVFGDRK